MSHFTYVAKLTDGRTVNGTLEAESPKSVIETLHQKGLVVVKIKQGKEIAGFSRGSVKMDDLAIFSRQMATLVDAGIPIVSGLEALAEQLENRTLRTIVNKVREAVDQGQSLTAALDKYRATFSPLFVNMVKAGEVSGHLAEVLTQLATYFEKSAALQRKIRTAMIYPSIVVMMAVGITSFLMIKVIPTFKQVFITLGAKLPVPTQILLQVSGFMEQYFLFFLGGVVGGFFLFRQFIKTKAGRYWFDRTLLRLPIVGPLVRKIAIAKFSRTLSTLVKSGVQILEALEIVSETTGNRVVGEAVLKVKASIREGENISGPLAASGVFPPMVVRMISVGEQTGRLDDMLTKVAEFYEEQVDSAVAGLTSTIEPVIIGVLGLVIGGIVVSIFLPIFQLTQVLAF